MTTANGPGRTSPAGDFDYDNRGAGYARIRRTDPRIAAHVLAALGPAERVLNVGAGAGSYEPADRYVVAVEPSAGMRAQRPADRVPAVDATAEALPFDTDAFDAAMATITVHQWADWRRGLAELRRVSRGPVVILTFDGDALPAFWLNEYCPEIVEAEQHRYQPIGELADALGGQVDVQGVPIPLDCVDGFGEAFYGRPERLLEDAVRRAQSGWAFVEPEAEARFVAHLTDDLATGIWDGHYGHLRTQPEFAGSLRLIVAT